MMMWTPESGLDHQETPPFLPPQNAARFRMPVVDHRERHHRAPTGLMMMKRPPVN